MSVPKYDPEISLKKWGLILNSLLISKNKHRDFALIMEHQTYMSSVSSMYNTIDGNGIGTILNILSKLNDIKRFTFSDTPFTPLVFSANISKDQILDLSCLNIGIVEHFESLLIEEIVTTLNRKKIDTMCIYDFLSSYSIEDNGSNVKLIITMNISFISRKDKLERITQLPSMKLF